METLIRGGTRSVSSLCASERKHMLELMMRYYDGVSREQFNNDLNEKEAVMLMHDSKTLDIVGFSTFMIIDIEVGNNLIKGFFSGDTVVHADYRKTNTLGVELGKNFLATIKRFPQSQVYWILISKGCRTYRLLPMFFYEWYPRYDKETPSYEKNIIDVFGAKKYPVNYDSVTGRIIFPDGGEALKSGVSDAHEGRRNDPHIQYFIERNPHYMRGDELVCVAKIKVDNFAPLLLRMLHGAGVILHE